MCFAGMYHMGVCRQLLEVDCLPDIITGASGGSILAAMLAAKTREELLNQVMVNDISTRYLSEGIYWFPPGMVQMLHFLRNGVLIDGDHFAKTTRRYYGDITFEEAFKKTGRHVSINISASSSMTNNGSYKLVSFSSLC
jgi:TAG lipase/steryl ester hydrolase/phospholipase A2/LPA acyltransferase